MNPLMMQWFLYGYVGGCVSFALLCVLWGGLKR